MTARLTRLVPDMCDPVADAMRDHIAKLLEPVTYERLKPTNGAHPVELHQARLRKHLQARSLRERVSAAMESGEMPVTALPDVVTKECSKCGDTKPLIAFSADKRYRLGVASRCKACTRVAVRQAKAA